MPKIEDAVWNPPRKVGRIPSESVKLFRSIQPGETKRIVHEDVVCNIRGRCSLFGMIGKLRKAGWEIQTYHEAPNVMVVRRLK